MFDMKNPGLAQNQRLLRAPKMFGSTFHQNYCKALTGLFIFFTMGVKNVCLDYSRKIFEKINKC